MIRIYRPVVAPDPETVKKLDLGRREVMRFLKDPARQTRFDFPTKFFGKAKELLRQIQHEKCAFCESAIGAAIFGELQNFRPRSHFPDQAYDWDNMLVTCQICNANKRDQFPTTADGTPLLVDPASEWPGDSIYFTRECVAMPLTPKGEATIKTFALNRPELINARRIAVQQYVNSGQGPPADKVVYAGVIRSVLDLMAVGGPMLRKDAPRDKVDNTPSGKTTSAKIPPGVDSSKTTNREFSYISSLEIRNFRALTDVKLDVPLSDGLPGWQVLLGENAAGKSTVLKAIAMALMGSEFLDSVNAYQKGILRRYKNANGLRESNSGSVIIRFVSGEKTVLRISRSGIHFETTCAVMDGTVRGYGSMRLLPEEDDDPGMSSVIADVGNLFHPRQTLVNTEKLLTKLYTSDRAKFEQFATHIRYLLRLENPLDVVEGELWVPINGTPVRISELSDGYQAMIALAVDLMNSFTDFKTMESAPGILLLDELGTHLHPRWRLEFVERFRATFRGLQVIATTHEPLCLRGLKKGEVSLLRRNQAGNVELVKSEDLPDIEGMRVDQILTSPIFGLHSTIDPKIEADFVRYYSLLAKSNLTTDEEEQKDQLATTLKPHRHLAYTRRDQFMYEIIDQFLAEDAHAPRQVRQELKSKTMQKLREIWDEVGIPGIDGGIQ